MALSLLAGSSPVPSCELLPRLPLPASVDVRPLHQSTLNFFHRKRYRPFDVSCDSPVKETKAVKRSSSTSYPSPSPPPYHLRRRSTSSTSTSATSSSQSSSPVSPSSPLSSPSANFRSQRDLWIDQVTAFPSNGWTNFPLTVGHTPQHPPFTPDPRTPLTPPLPFPLSPQVAGVSDDPERGLGVFAGSFIPKHRLVLEYHGDLLTRGEKLRRSDEYLTRIPFPGSYMFEFRWEGRDWARDATEVGPDDGEKERVWGYGRYVNHSRERDNLYGKVITVNRIPHLCFFSSKPIEAGEELLIDYKDRSKVNREANPWLDR